MENASPHSGTLRPAVLLSYFALIAWVGLWHGWLSPHAHVTPWAVTLGWLIPLMLPLKGIIQGNAYTHAWANFVLMFYFLHALTIVWVDEGERWLALVELLLTSVAFLCNIYYARWKGREQGLKLKKLSQVEKEERERFGN